MTLLQRTAAQVRPALTLDITVDAVGKLLDLRRELPPDALERSAEEAAQKLATLNMAAHAGTKARARGAVIKMIRDMIDEDITPQYGEDRVARRASA